MWEAVRGEGADPRKRVGAFCGPGGAFHGAARTNTVRGRSSIVGLTRSNRRGTAQPLRRRQDYLSRTTVCKTSWPSWIILTLLDTQGVERCDQAGL